MAITLKNESVERMAREAAKLGHSTLTDAIGEALQAHLARLRRQRTAPLSERLLLEIADRCATLPDLVTRSETEILGYDDHGLLPHGH